MSSSTRHLELIDQIRDPLPFNLEGRRSDTAAWRATTASLTAALLPSTTEREPSRNHDTVVFCVHGRLG